ncbi:rhomboid family intramembrane serine protease [Chloroflexota bacterium]
MRVRYRSYPGFSLSPVLVLVIVNLLVFIAVLIVRELIFLLGLQPAGFLSRPWTILTSMFVHASFWHIFANMLTLYFFGNYLSRLIGDRKFLIVYFGGGILGNILLLILSPLFPFSVAVGASGAVFALAGVLVVVRPRMRVFVFPIPVPIPLWIAVIGGFLVLSFLPYIAWQAHLGGLVLGLVAGYIFRRRGHYFFF